MRIKSLYIKKYKILEEFNINFDQDINTNVIIGKNGSGKTTLFEAIIKIFRELSLARAKRDLSTYYDLHELRFRIVYECKGYQVCFENIEELKLIVGDEEKSLSDSFLKPTDNRYDFSTRPIFKYLPDHIITYYSGESKRVTSLFEKHREIFSDALKEGVNLPLREFYNVDTRSIRQILLSLFLYKKNEGALIEQEPAIASFYDCKLNIKKPSWHKTAENNFNKEFELSSEDALYEYNPELYHAKGELGRFFKNLVRYSFKSVDGDFISSISFPSYEEDQLLGFRIGVEKETAIDFFKMLDELEYSELLNNILYKVHLPNSEEPIELDQLSEGQNQISLVIGLKELFKDTETLFLFDEPDTYLHPEWQIKLMKELNQKSDKHQVLATTHSTTGLSRINKESLFQLQNGKLLPKIQIPIYGADSNLILKDVQNVNNSIPDEIENRRKGIFDMISNGDISGAELLLAEIESEGVADSVWIRKIRRKIKIEKALKR